MKKLVPSYYNEFKCTASECQDSCCIGWEIDIDEKTLQRYEEAEKTTGFSILEHIDREAEEPYIKLKGNGRCPFLNEDNLCDIYIKLGEDALSHICTLHPRFIQNFGVREEYGLDLCCEEAARLILSQRTFPTFFLQELECPQMAPENVNEEDFRMLEHCRQEIFGYLDATNEPILEIMQRVLSYCDEVEELCGEECYEEVMACSIGDIDVMDYKVATPTKEFYRDSLEFFRGLIPLSVSWHNFLAEVAADFDEIYEKWEAFHREYLSFDWEAKLLLHHYVYRYFMEGLWTGEIFCQTFACIHMIRMVELLDVAWYYYHGEFTFANQVYICCQMAKEIEYSTENMRELQELAWQGGDFDAYNRNRGR